MNRRGQSAIEFVFLASFMLLFFSVSIVYVQQLLVEFTAQGKTEMMGSIASAVERELERAARLPDGYERVFSLPGYVQGLPYTIEVQEETPPRKDALVVRVGEDQLLRFVDYELNGTIVAGKNTLAKTGGQIIAN